LSVATGSRHETLRFSFPDTKLHCSLLTDGSLHRQTQPDTRHTWYRCLTWLCLHELFTYLSVIVFDLSL